MANFKDTIAYGFIKHALPLLILSGLAGYALSLFSLGLNINVSNYYQSAVTLTTGAMIAIFLAVFYSTSLSMKYARSHKGAFSLYVVILFDLFCIVLSGLFVGHDVFGDYALSLVTMCMLDVLYLIAVLAQLALRD